MVLTVLPSGERGTEQLESPGEAPALESPGGDQESRVLGAMQLRPFPQARVQNCKKATL